MASSRIHPFRDLNPGYANSRADARPRHVIPHQLGDVQVKSLTFRLMNIGSGNPSDGQGDKKGEEEGFHRVPLQ